MQQTLKQIEIVLEEKIPQFIKMLNPPATESDFEALEAVIGSKLPEAFKTFYRWHNGQNRSPYVAFHIETHEILMPIEEIIEWYEELN
ncbi:SMI1/KNR4 family protein [Psychrobacter sp.]|uniref:SMI1/KNR4 family protein n=1 Tax=Psychrobacter sp. TaxID=56811 RepID=UPI0025F6F945|nr:SMI1/KNR4 family protein [Psychrobacter sp.]